MGPTVRRMSEFEYYLRTGRRVGQINRAPRIGLKFNPWHDPDDGRFTFRNSGEYWPGDGFGGFGGGGFNGGGADGEWDPPKPKPKPRPTAAPSPIVPHLSDERDSEVHERASYRFRVDNFDRTSWVTGEAKLGTNAGRSRRLQRTAGEGDRRSTDDGGHYIAPRFNGPREKFNHFAQDRNFNRGGYREMEREWGKHIVAGRKVLVTIVPAYDGQSRRPSTITVYWNVNGRKKKRIFQNEHGGRKNGR